MNEIKEILDTITQIGELVHLKLINETDSKLIINTLITEIKTALDINCDHINYHTSGAATFYTSNKKAIVTDDFIKNHPHIGLSKCVWDEKLEQYKIPEINIIGNCIIT